MDTAIVIVEVFGCWLLGDILLVAAWMTVRWMAWQRWEERHQVRSI